MVLGAAACRAVGRRWARAGRTPSGQDRCGTGGLSCPAARTRVRRRRIRSRGGSRVRSSLSRTWFRSSRGHPGREGMQRKRGLPVLRWRMRLLPVGHRSWACFVPDSGSGGPRWTQGLRRPCGTGELLLWPAGAARDTEPGRPPAARLPDHLGQLSELAGRSRMRIEHRRRAGRFHSRSPRCTSWRTGVSGRAMSREPRPPPTLADRQRSTRDLAEPEGPHPPPWNGALCSARGAARTNDAVQRTFSEPPYLCRIRFQRIAPVPGGSCRFVLILGIIRGRRRPGS
jgi:hypothetical protein